MAMYMCANADAFLDTYNFYNYNILGNDSADILL